MRSRKFARASVLQLTRILIWPAITADSHRRNPRTVWLVSGIWLIGRRYALFIAFNNHGFGVVGEKRTVPMNLLTVLSFPMAGSSFYRAVDLLRQSLTLETQFIILVPKFLVEKKRKCNAIESIKGFQGYAALWTFWVTLLYLLQWLSRIFLIGPIPLNASLYRNMTSIDINIVTNYHQCHKRTQSQRTTIKLVFLSCVKSGLALRDDSNHRRWDCSKNPQFSIRFLWVLSTHSVYSLQFSYTFTVLLVLLLFQKLLFLDFSKL